MADHEDREPAVPDNVGGRRPCPRVFPYGAVVELSHYTNGDRGNWSYGMSFHLPDGGGQNTQPLSEEDEGEWEDPNLRRPTENFSYTFGSGPDNTDEDDGDLSGGEEGPAPIGFAGYGGFRGLRGSGLSFYSSGDDTAPPTLDFPGGRLVLLSSLPGGKKR